MTLPKKTVNQKRQTFLVCGGHAYNIYLAGLLGATCDVRIDYCGRLKPCQNGAQCRNQLETYLCECKPGYTNKNCSTNIDECAGQPCLNNGNCTDGINKFSCKCPVGFAGDRCEESKNLFSLDLD